MKEISRQDLFELVWSSPAYKVAADFGVSGRGLAKACAKHEVPVPGRGHWAKLRAGHRIKRPRLKEASRPGLETVRIGAQARCRSTMGEPPPVVAATPLAEVEPIVVSPRRRLKHALVVKTRNTLKSDQTDRYDLYRPSSECLAVRVGPRSLLRALRLLDALFCAMEREGWPISVRDGGTGARVGEEWVTFELKERLTKRTVARRSEGNGYRYEREMLVPSGRFVLEVSPACPGLRGTFADGQDQSVESLLTTVVQQMPKYAAVARQARLEREERQRRWAEEERKRREARQRLQELQTWSARWAEAQSYRLFLAAAQKAFDADSSSFHEGFAEWLRWAEDHVAQLDPLSPAAHEEAT